MLLRDAPALRLSIYAIIALCFGILGCAPRAWAVPAFAAQTGQPCQTCHVGGFGPQLTPYGRLFKLNGYTTRSGPTNAPLAMMVVASYLRTQKDQPPPPPSGFRDNDNVALDQASVFLAGGVGAHFGGIVQGTYDGVGKAWHWDNLDLRAVTTVKLKGLDARLGLSLNNNPTVQDPWNTLAAWGYPYTSSALAPAPAAQPLVSGPLAQTTMGLTGYAWINSTLYLEAGGYWSPRASVLQGLGVDPTALGDISGVAPYARVAAQTAFGDHTIEAGAFFLQAGVFPGLDRAAGVSDLYRDIGLDASDQWTMANGDVATINLRYTHERRRLAASQALGLASNLDDRLNDVRADASYYWRGKIGGTVQVFDTAGSADALLFPSDRTFKPDTSGLMFQIDGTPFGDGRQPQRRLNLRAGLQYTLYTRFNGARTNFDGAGRRASDNNTLRVFTWLAF